MTFMVASPRGLMHATSRPIQDIQGFEGSLPYLIVSYPAENGICGIAAQPSVLLYIESNGQETGVLVEKYRNLMEVPIIGLPCRIGP